MGSQWASPIRPSSSTTRVITGCACCRSTSHAAEPVARSSLLMVKVVWVGGDTLPLTQTVLVRRQQKSKELLSALRRPAELDAKVCPLRPLHVPHQMHSQCGWDSHMCVRSDRQPAQLVMMRSSWERTEVSLRFGTTHCCPAKR